MIMQNKIDPEIFFTVTEQTELFLLSVIMGIIFGIVFDIFRALRTMLPPLAKAAPTAVCDALYLIICGFGIYVFSLTFARGDIRFYYAVGAFLGAVIYILTIGNIIISILRWLFGGIYSILHRVIIFLSKPFVKTYKKISTKIGYKFVTNAEKISDRCKNRKKHLKNMLHLVYNKKAKMR